MFFSDPVTFWFRRKSCDADAIKLPSQQRPSISVTEDDDDIDDVFSSSSASPDSPQALCLSPIAPKAQKRSSKLRKDKKRQMKLGRSASICVPVQSSSDKSKLLPPLPQILVEGDSPHRLERSLSNNIDLKPHGKLSPFSGRRVSSPSGRFSPFQNMCFDFDSIPDKLRALQEEWRAGRDSKRRVSRSESRRGKDNSSSSLWSRSPSKSPCPDSPQLFCAHEDDSCDDDEEIRIQTCQSNGCKASLTATRICHHPQCTDDNNGQPLLLCRQCDLDIHRNREYSGHLVLDIKVKSPGPLRPPSPDVDYEDDSESDTQNPAGEDRVDGMFTKHNSQIRNKTSTTELERKLKRKMALKKKVKTELDAYLAQIADPEGTDPIPVFRPEAETTDNRFVFENVNHPGFVSQDSLESLNEDIQAVEYSSLNTKLPVRRQPRVSAQDSHFTLKFATPDGSRDDLEVVAAVQQTTLRDAIESALVRRNIDVNTINVFIEKSRTPLPLSSISKFLAGNVLEVKEKCDRDPEITVHGKSRPGSNKSGTGKGSKQSGGSLRGRSRSGNLSVDDTFYPSSSPGGSWSEAKRGKSPKLSVVNLFTPTNKDKERQDQLSEILNRYSLHGLPPFPELLSLGRPKFDHAIFELESSWKSIVVSHESLTKKQQEHQEAVWELLLTEVSYIKQIRVIIDVFQNCLINVQQESFLNEIETERLFSNIDKVFECNCVFWQQYLLPVLQRGRDCRQPLDPLLSKEGFVDHFPSMFQVYFKFFIEHKSCLEYAKSCMENSDLFKIFIQWAEAQKQCNRLKLADILVKPMQRLLKYSLLLQAVLRFTENSKDRTEIQEMIQSIDKLCWAANNSLRRREDYEKLEAVRKTIDPFDAIEAPNDECAKIIQEYNGSFNLLAPMPGFRDGPRSLLFHSSLRMREGQSIKLDIDCLLFTDLILICKSNKRMERFKIIRPPMRLDQLVVSELKDKGSFLLIYMNEYQVPISAFTFHSDTGAVRLWVDKFREAQVLSLIIEKLKTIWR